MSPKSGTLHHSIFVCFVLLIFLICPWLSLKTCTCVHAQLCLILCDSKDCSLPGFSGLPFPITGVLPNSEIKPLVSCIPSIDIWILYHPATWKTLSFGKGKVTELVFNLDFPLTSSVTLSNLSEAHSDLSSVKQQ